MRQTVLAILALSVATVFALPSTQAQQRHPRAQSRSYDACLSLAIQRGWRMDRADYYGREKFIYDCMRGRQS
jgi:hypothetical protein